MATAEQDGQDGQDDGNGWGANGVLPGARAAKVGRRRRRAADGNGSNRAGREARPS